MEVYVRQYIYWQQRAGFIARVITFGTQHVCGVCRSRFFDRWQAESCLDNCWGELLDLDPVIRQLTHDTMIFKCRFCARRHDHFQRAKTCAEACRTHFQHKHALERQVLGELADMPVPAKRKRKSPAKKTYAPSQFAEANRSPSLKVADGPSPKPNHKIAAQKHAQSLAHTVAELADDNADADNELEELVDAI